MKITILMDSPSSWYRPYAEELVKKLRLNNEVYFIHTASEITSGECAFFLSCEKLIKPEVLAKNRHNLVVHSSPLPVGKGWSPLTWQILEAKTSVTNTLFEAVKEVDAGVIYLQDEIQLDGTELLPELHAKQGASINKLVMQFVEIYPNITGRIQAGKESFFPRRRPADSELDPNKTLAEQFNLLRVVDNEKYPAFFFYRGQKYILKIYKNILE